MKRYELKRDLPTFKAGEVFYLSDAGNLFRESDDIAAYSWSTIDKFPNILTDWFEEIKPAEPLIKDEKIRKAVRAWAEANEISQVQFDRYIRGFSASDAEHNILSMISFDGFVFMFVDGKIYTIDELCGEEEE